ncbi:MAG TPA: hypothetical protein VE691_01710 [Rubrobacter sp.]|nr:hypothetical protein [Rubrobacter sp.]
MDGRQPAYPRGWLRAPLGEPAHQPEGTELASDLNLACELYLRGDEALRREIRGSFEGWTAVRGPMLAQAWSFANRLADTCDDRWLRLGLAAVSIDDNGTDYRDTYVALGDMYVCAVRRGMEPVTYFEEAAEISFGVSNIEQTSMRDFLLRFEESAYFGEAIAPKLS